MVNVAIDRIAKQQLNIILLIDASKSMEGRRIKQVNDAIKEIKDYLVDLQGENTNVDFYMTIIPFSTEASFYKSNKMINISSFNFKGIKTGGWSNLHCGYDYLAKILKKESKGGIMPDFGGIAPIILLLTDGHPTTNKYKESLKKLKELPWFNVSMRYGVAIELDDSRTMQVLHEFVEGSGDVIRCFSADVLKQIIQIIVITASKVKSTTTEVHVKYNTTKHVETKQLIAEALSQIENWGW